MSTLYLIRHGQASYGAANYDVLSDVGRQQAEAVGRHWAIHNKLDALYTGPLQRQRDTARHLHAAASDRGHDLPDPIVIDELAEYPAFEMLRVFLPKLLEEDETLRALASPLDGQPHDPVALADRAFDRIIHRWAKAELLDEAIESFAAFHDRVRRAVELIVANHGSGHCVAAVTSGGPIAIALRLALGLEAISTMTVGRNVRNASITELRWRTAGFEWRAGDFSLMTFNSVHHLPPTLVTFR